MTLKLSESTQRRGGRFPDVCMKRTKFIDSKRGMVWSISTSFLAALSFWTLFIPQAIAQPDNDSFALRSPLPSGSFTNRAYMLDATAEPGENMLWNANASRSTVWYAWQAPTNGWLRLQNRGAVASPQRVIGLFSGSGITQLFGLGFGQTTASPAVPVKSGSNYVIGLNLLANSAVPPGAELEFSGEFQAAAANDFFAAAQTIVGSATTVIGSSTGSSLEPGEPTNGNPAAKNSVWFTWLSPDNGNLTIAPTVQWTGRSMTALKGSSILSMTTVATSSGSPVVFPVSSGDPIRIVVGDQYSSGYPIPENFSFTLGFSQFSISSTQANSKVLARTNLVLDLNNLPAGVISVSLFRDNTLIGQYSGAPTSVVVSNLAAGNYRFSARADLSSGITLMAPQTEIRLLPVLGHRLYSARGQLVS